MKLIADSGSSKTAWASVENGRVVDYFQTSGLNPFILKEKEIERLLKEELIPLLTGSITEIHFFGAGCNETGSKIIEKALLSLFPESKLSVKSDIEGCAIALFGKDQGIISILGTGSASGFYDGTRITFQVPSLGYLLGDEGSGCYIGRQLISDYFKGMMPESVAIKFREYYPYSLIETLDKIYHSDRPNQFLASVMPFLSQHRNFAYCEELIGNSFLKFIDRNLYQYDDLKETALGFCGSVAWHFGNELKAHLRRIGISDVTIIQQPIQQLAAHFCAL